MTQRDLVRNAWVEQRVDELRDAMTGQEPDLTLALGNYRQALHELALLRDVASEWLDATDDADADDPTIHDYYARVGARWGRGGYYRRFRDALNESPRVAA